MRGFLLALAIVACAAFVAPTPADAAPAYKWRSNTGRKASALIKTESTDYRARHGYRFMGGGGGGGAQQTFRALRF